MSGGNRTNSVCGMRAKEQLRRDTYESPPQTAPGGTMSKLRCHISISLDGCVAGPDQSEENPLGEGGEQLHEWGFRLAAWRQLHGKQGGEVNESARIVEESRE